MIQSNLFKRHYLISVITIVVFLILGFFAQHLIMRATAPTPKDLMNLRAPSLGFYARLVDELNSEDPVKGLAKLEELNQDSQPFRFSLVPSDPNAQPEPGAVIYPLPHHPDQSLRIEFKDHFMGGPPMPPPPPDGDRPEWRDHGPGRPGGPGFRRPPPPEGGPMPPRGGPPLKMIIIIMVVQIACVILGAGFSIYMLFRSLKSKAVLADQVLAELQKGNLKARFPITKMDEIGQAMSRFNKMADEIERLVEQMKQVERSRVSLLQDLTHDLRTPIASLKNLLETLESRKGAIDPQVLVESLGLAVKEVDYFERLVEDLLVIAQMSEPKYHLDSKSISLVDLLEEEIETVLGHSSDEGKNIQFINETGDPQIQYAGDAHLLKRMFRNGIENAYSFAKKNTVVRISKNNQQIKVQIEDDGPGFSPSILDSFGTRKMTRVMSSASSGRLSVGLGSVIMKTVANLHRGNLHARNRISDHGRVEGATVEIVLPTTV